MIYILSAVFAVVMFFGSVCTCFKWGEDDGICNYNYKED